MKLPELPDLPVRSALGEIVATLAEHGVAVLVAPPGTGKTTLVPLALAAATEGRVVVAEPRRLAARAAAARMAALLGERVGQTVGYSVRGDRKVGPRTRIEVVTSGLLVRRLQQDPELPGITTVILDECHERHLDADLLLALLLDARSGLRPDLSVLATSATVAAGRLAVLLGSGGSEPAQVTSSGGESSSSGAPGAVSPLRAGEREASAVVIDRAQVAPSGSADSRTSSSDARPQRSAAIADLAQSSGEAASGSVDVHGSASGAVPSATSDSAVGGVASAGLSGSAVGGVASAGLSGVVTSGESSGVASAGSAVVAEFGVGAAPVLEVRGRAYPVEVEYVPALPRERVEAQVARAVRAALAAVDGDVLVFLPGVGEINRTAGLLRDLDGVDVVVLHGRLGGAAQDSALRPGERRRVVLSTAVAESSLTVPGVRAVVDSGLSRVPRVDHRRGLSGLATVRVSAAVAEQRAGRAGREAPGRAWRCWPEYEHQTLPAYPEPEIRTAELTRLALELACWGTPDGTALTWWDAPPEGALAAGHTVLRALGALDDTDHITPRGRAMATLGLHPRLARALLDGATHLGPRPAAEMVALLDDDSLAPTPDAATALRHLRTDRPPRWTKEVNRLLTLLTHPSTPENPATLSSASDNADAAESETVVPPAEGSDTAEVGRTGTSAAEVAERAADTESGPAAASAAGSGAGAAGVGRIGAGAAEVAERAADTESGPAAASAAGSGAGAAGVGRVGAGAAEIVGTSAAAGRDAAAVSAAGSGAGAAGVGRIGAGAAEVAERAADTESGPVAVSAAGSGAGAAGVGRVGAGAGEIVGTSAAAGSDAAAVSAAGSGAGAAGVGRVGAGAGEIVGTSAAAGSDAAPASAAGSGTSSAGVGKIGAVEVAGMAATAGSDAAAVLAAGRGVETAGVGRVGASVVAGRGRGVGEVAALMIALAQPERLARRRAGGSSYLMAGGTAVTLPPGSGLAEAEWLAVAVADRDPGRAEGRIRLAAIADEDLARQAAPGLVTSGEEVRWESGEVVARRVERLGAIVLSEKPLREPDPALLGDAVRAGLRTEGLDLLRWTDDARTLRHRLDFLHRTLGAPWPAVDDTTLLANLDTWLAPELATARRRADLTRIDAGTALRRLLPWPEAARLDDLAPDRLEVPSGSRIRVDYSADQPVLAVKVQEIFGWTTPPTLADGRATLLLHLLSPAQRPVAVTADLPSFWRTGWPQVRADLRGRYPKHAWPEDPTTFTPHRGTTRRANLDR